MKLDLTDEQESKLAELAAREGVTPNQFIVDLLAHYLDPDPDFVRAVEQGIASADRGELIDHEEVVRRIEARLAS